MADTLLDDYRFGGIRFIESPDRPVCKLGEQKCFTRYGDEVPWISPAMRAEVNAWLLATFGTTNLVPKDTFYFSSMYGFAMGRPSDILKLAMI